MAALYETKGFGSAQEFVAAARNGALVSAVDPGAKDLEGYLFPDTYKLPRHATAEQLVARMVAGFMKTLTPDLIDKAEGRGLTVRQFVTLASIVEKETGTPEERPLVAAVYSNRLKIGMGLQCDPTVIYALERAGRYDGNLRRDDLQFDSPYNTYRYAGLPPGPIASPGRASLAAAASPASVPYLYFVSKNDGSHAFAATLDEHNRNVQQYQVRYFRAESRVRSPFRHALGPGLQSAVSGCQAPPRCRTARHPGNRVLRDTRAPGDFSKPISASFKRAADPRRQTLSIPDRCREDLKERRSPRQTLFLGNLRRCGAGLLPKLFCEGRCANHTPITANEGGHLLVYLRIDIRDQPLADARDVWVDVPHQGFDVTVRGRLPGHQVPVAAPWPVTRMGTESSPDWIQKHISTQPHQIDGGLDDLRFESALKDVSDVRVPLVPPLRVAPVQMPHGERQIRSARAQHEMEVVRHVAIEPGIDLELRDGVGKHFQKACVIEVVKKDGHLVVAASHDVVGEAGALESKRSRHAEAVPKFAPAKNARQTEDCADSDSSVRELCESRAALRSQEL